MIFEGFPDGPISTEKRLEKLLRFSSARKSKKWFPPQLKLRQLRFRWAEFGGLTRAEFLIVEIKSCTVGVENERDSGNPENLETQETKVQAYPGRRTAQLIQT